MKPGTASFRHAGPHELAQALRAARNYTLSLFDCFAAQGLHEAARVPRMAEVNPPLWELGHVAWFAEWFALRGARSSEPGAASAPSLLHLGDEWFSSAAVAHDARWMLPLPRPGAVKTYCHEVLDRMLDQLARSAGDDASLYPYRLALAHEDMHGEAMRYTLQTLGALWPEAPPEAPAPAAPVALACPGGTLHMGSRPGGGFVFDNEKWSHPVYVPPFTVDAGLVSNAQFAEFVGAGGYADDRNWTDSGRAWRARQDRGAPRYWRRDAGGWAELRHGSLAPLDPHQPVRHVSLHEAQAYCAWSGRRLPTESEWEHAATCGIPGFRWGELWEWTATPFEPYPGFSPDAYREYSVPSFGTHQVLRGASFATPPRMASPRFRNFFLPSRDDIFCGFRTCAP